MIGGNHNSWPPENSAACDSASTMHRNYKPAGLLSYFRELS
jgi:hypothetical protein